MTVDPLNPWAGDVAPTPVEPPERAPNGPQELPPPDLPPAPGPRQTWEAASSVEPPPPPRERRADDG